MSEPTAFMSEPTAFPFFALFPREIRLEIWAYSIQPRLITFECELYNFNPRRAPPSIYLVGGDPPYRHFEIDVPQRPTSPYYIVQSYPSRLRDSPPLLSTCKESREFALRYGYRCWTIQNQVLGTRDVMWNPKVDAVSLQLSPHSGEPCLDVFVEQFPEQVSQIQRLAVWSSYWLPGHERDTTPWSTILRFSKLFELIVIVSQARDIEGLAQAAVDGVEACLRKEKKELKRKAMPGSEKFVELELWHPTKIRAVGSEDEFLREL